VHGNGTVFVGAAKLRLSAIKLLERNAPETFLEGLIELKAVRHARATSQLAAGISAPKNKMCPSI
jgi:hypothetical protein